jgi:hypothetical protein
MDLQDIITAYSAEYKLNPDNRKRLRNKLYNNNTQWDEYFTRIPTENTKEDWTFTEHSEVLQPYQHPWTPKGELSATDYQFLLYWAKLDIEEVPDKLVKTWLGFLAENFDGDRTKYPFVRWYIENHLIPKMHEDRYLAWGFLGEFVAPTSGTAGAASTTGDGWRKIIRTLVGLNKITPWVGGTFPTTASGMVDYIEAMVKATPEQHAGRKLQIGMRQHNLDLYDEGYRTKYHTYFPDTKTGLSVRNYPNITLQGFGNMSTSNLVTMSDKSNRLLFQKGSPKKEIVRVESLKRNLFLFTDFHEGFGIDTPSEFFINDQDLS